MYIRGSHSCHAFDSLHQVQPPGSFIKSTLYMWFDNLTYFKIRVSALGCKYILTSAINVMDDYLLFSS